MSDLDDDLWLRERLLGTAADLPAEVGPSDAAITGARRAYRRHVTSRVAAGVAVLALVGAVTPTLLDRFGAPTRPTVLGATGGAIDDLTTPPIDDEAPDADERPVTALPPAPLTPRTGIASAWTGDGWFLWGGVEVTRSDGVTQTRTLADGAIYDPAARTWHQLAMPEQLLDARSNATAVWTGTEVLVVGGHHRLDPTQPTYDPDRYPSPLEYAAYDPATDTWRPMAEAPIDNRQDFTATWTGEELVVWGGWRGHPTDADADPILFADGAAYDPATDTWRTLADTPLTPRFDHLAVWNGRRLVVAGGNVAADIDEGHLPTVDHGTSSAAVYDPAQDTWTVIENSPFHGGVGALPHAFDGTLLYVWNGVAATAGIDPTTWSWDPTSGTSTPLADAPLPARTSGTGAMIGSRFVVTSGTSDGTRDVAVFDPGTRSWTVAPFPSIAANVGAAVVWVDDTLLVWGGLGDRRLGESVDTGFAWRPFGDD